MSPKINQTWREQEQERLWEREEREQNKLGLARLALAKACHVNDLNERELNTLLELVNDYEFSQRQLWKVQDELARLG